MPKKRSKDEIIQEITEYMEKYPNTNRKKITIACSINGVKLSELEKLGLIKLPKKIKPGANGGWRSFKE